MRSKLYSRVYHALKIFLFKKSVDVLLFCIHRKCLPLNRLAFSYVTELRFQSTDAWSCPHLNDILGVPRV